MAMSPSLTRDFALHPVASDSPAADLALPDPIAPDPIAADGTEPDLVAPDLVAQGVLGAYRVAPELMVRLALVLDAGAGGLSGVDSEGALRVVEAVEAVKAWADSVSVAATAAMVTE